MKSFSFSALAFTYVVIVLTALVPHVFSYDYPIEFPPAWLKIGTYAEYNCVTSMVGGAEKPFSFRWRCTGLDGMTATLNLSLVGLPAGNFSAVVDIITNTRELVAANGTVLGKTFLWLPPNLKVGDRVIVDGKPPNERISEVDVSGGGSGRTPQGFQEIYDVIPFNYVFGCANIDGLFDLDTGVLIEGPLLDHTTILGCFGFTEVRSWIKSFNATNIDLGPRYLKTEILEFLWASLPIIVPSGIFIGEVGITVRKRRKKRSKQINASKISTKEQRNKSNIPGIPPKQ